MATDRGPQGDLARADIDLAVQRAAEAEERRKRGLPPEGGIISGAADIGAATAYASGTSGGYRIDNESLAALITEFEEIRDRIERQTDRWTRAGYEIHRPADDPPSVEFTDDAEASSKIGHDANLGKVQRIRAFIDDMKRAHGGYETQEEGVAESLQGGAMGDWLNEQNNQAPEAGHGSLYDKDYGE